MIFIILIIILFLQMGIKAQPPKPSVYHYEAPDMSGKMIKLSEFSDAKAILITNINSRCNHAYHEFRRLNRLHEMYSDKGLVILGFPCNDFGNEEDEDSHHRYSVQLSFPVMGRVVVTGGRALELFSYLKYVTGRTEIKWNFHKFVINGTSGKPTFRFDEDHPVEDVEMSIRHLLRIPGKPEPEVNIDEALQHRIKKVEAEYMEEFHLQTGYEEDEEDL